MVVATAGWSIASIHAAAFPADGSSLERYARVFTGVEVNSSFHRRHRATTWAKWASSVPEDFRFSVKIPKTITHEAKLIDTGPLIAEFRQEIAALGHKLAVLLVQLPPKLDFDAGVAATFFATLKNEMDVAIACEPRHPSWFEPDADAALEAWRVARVAADPALGPAAASPGGWRGLAYWRLHGSPVMYRSSYSEDEIAAYARRIPAEAQQGHDVWCVFDNTASSAATGNALSMLSQCSVPDISAPVVTA